MIKSKHKIVFGDSRNMSQVEDRSVHLIITSPPYWQLKDYDHRDQIGFDDKYEDYINNLNLVWFECHRVLHQGCKLCVNIGDQFARSVYYGRYKVIPIRTEIIKFCEYIGFDYMGAIIWQKVTTSNTTGGATVMGSYPYPRNGILKLDYEFILIFKKLGKSPPPSSESKSLSKLTNEEWNEYFTGHWNFGGEKQNGHIAMFPEELPKRLIKMYSFKGETILDPFLGSGTTTLAAKNLKRHSIGYEINKSFKEKISKRIGADSNDLFERNFEIEFVEEKSRKIDKSKLPYLYKDPIKLSKKIDPRKLHFGSKITGKEGKREELFSIKKIVSTDKIILDSGQLVRLLGIKPLKEKEAESLKFLSNLVKNQKVYLKFDEIKYDEKDNLLAYLYLKNKTFINAHLIKNKLAAVDSNFRFKYKSKFVELYGNSE
jgi:site-specific DNA-methyltransferase (adenine-specific)